MCMPISSRRSDRDCRLRVLFAGAVVLAGALPAIPAGAAAPTAPSAPASAAILPPAGSSTPPAPAAELQETLLAIVVNGEPMPATLLLQRPDGGILARTSDLARWRFAASDATPVVHDGQSYLPLDALPGVRFHIDPATQTLHIDTTAKNFISTVVSSGTRRYSTPPPAPLGGYFNYDLSVLSADRQTSAGGIFEAVGFGPWGTLYGNAVARSATGSAGSGGAAGGVLRLDTTWTLDRPADRATWRVGDTISRAGSWGQPVRLGGVQYATNFGTQPGFVTFPLPSFAGVAAVPSTVDLYVNDALRLRSDVPAGPFTMPEMPVVTGSGEARVVVRDLLGRQQTILAPFYASSQLLRTGLRDFSYEVGALRSNFGRTSADYGALVAVATERRGLSDTLTGEVHAEVARDRQAAGFGAAWLWPAAGVFSASVAASRGAQGSGGLLSLGFQRQAARFSFGGNLLGTSDGFVPLGLPSDPRAPRRLAQAYASYSTRGYGTFAMNYVRQDLRDRPNVELVGASYSIALGRLGLLSLTLLRDVHGGQTSAGLNFSRPLDSATSFNANATARGESRNVQLQAQRNLPVGTGVGYRVMAVGGDSTRAEGNLLLQNDHGRYALDASVDGGGRTALRAGAAGSVAAIGSSVFASRRIDASFSVVEMPGFPNVRVYAANQLVGRTGADGSAMVPRLLPYQKNSIRIEQADLPLDATVDALGVDVVPNFRSGVLVRIPIRRSRGGLITVVLDDGGPVPAGAIAMLPGNPDLFPAGQQGEIYLTGLEKSNRVQLTWRDQRCEIDVAFPETDDPLPQLGTFTCHGVKR